MDIYFKKLMKNYPIGENLSDALTTDNIHSDDTKKLQSPLRGGGINDFPTGGFIPIFICDTETPNVAQENKERQYSTHTSTVSIKEIMKKRRDVTPLI
jgi:hypothetical protein